MKIVWFLNPFFAFLKMSDPGLTGKGFTVAKGKLCVTKSKCVIPSVLSITAVGSMTTFIAVRFVISRETIS